MFAGGRAAETDGFGWGRFYGAAADSGLAVKPQGSVVRPGGSPSAAGISRH
ncbi:hypothetical protein DSCA_16520 [Desulfosarcina alkanivorans]|uniref:Uncharacterized protein n=1 Tax=Desulfosarcina alkanivorans TaxID=571177 RepID=A0A5K7YDY8_9BACT|nr:hypothetical protein DSCA_16520 [Desulfosarcina alkanivorans]